MKMCFCSLKYESYLLLQYCRENNESTDIYRYMDSNCEKLQFVLGMQDIPISTPCVLSQLNVVHKIVTTDLMNTRSHAPSPIICGQCLPMLPLHGSSTHVVDISLATRALLAITMSSGVAR